MSFVTEPEVALIGKPVLEIDGIMRFLNEHRLDWPELTEKLESMMSLGDDDGEWLVEFAGRMCYQSWAKKGETANGRSHEDHIRHLIEIGHGSCLEHATFNFAIWNISRSLSHELVRHRIASYCLAGDTVIYSFSANKRHPGKKRTIKQLFEWYNDPKRASRIGMIRVKCFDGEQIVPAQIKRICQSGKKKLIKIITKNGYTIRCSIHHRFMIDNNEGTIVWAPAESLKTGDQIAVNGVRVYKDKKWLNKKYNIECLSQEEIGKMCGVSRHTIRSWIRKLHLQKPLGSWTIGTVPWNKNKSGYIIKREFTDEEKSVISARMTGDKNHRWKGNNATQHAGRIRAYRLFEQQSCKNCGNKDGHRHHIDGNTLNNNEDNIQFLCNRCHKIEHSFIEGKILRTIRFDEIVSIVDDGIEMTYDLEVDHPQHNFVANGFITHNSQLSQRYVDSSSVAFIVPPAIQELARTDEEAYRAWVEHCERSRQLYEELTGKLSEMYGNIDSKLEWRKKARQAARSVLSNATETKIVVSMNARAVRHLIELRANPAADVEIRALAVKVCRILQDKAPLFAHGLGIVQLSDGTEGVESAFKRV